MVVEDGPFVETEAVPHPLGARRIEDRRKEGRRAVPREGHREMAVADHVEHEHSLHVARAVRPRQLQRHPPASVKTVSGPVVVAALLAVEERQADLGSARRRGGQGACDLDQQAHAGARVVGALEIGNARLGVVVRADNDQVSPVAGAGGDDVTEGHRAVRRLFPEFVDPRLETGRPHAGGDPFRRLLRARRTAVAGAQRHEGGHLRQRSPAVDGRRVKPRRRFAGGALASREQEGEARQPQDDVHPSSIASHADASRPTSRSPCSVSQSQSQSQSQSDSQVSHSKPQPQGGELQPNGPGRSHARMRTLQPAARCGRCAAPHSTASPSPPGRPGGGRISTLSRPSRSMSFHRPRANRRR